MQYPTDIINHLIRNRRSVKPDKYNAMPVDEHIVLEILENARWAPTHGMTEPWRFFVFTGEGRKRFADFQAGLYKQTTPAEHFLEKKYQKLLDTPLKASHVILIGMKRQLNGKIPEVEEICSVACAVQNMQLTAAAYNIGSYWSTGGMTYHPALKNFLGLDEHDRCMGMVYLGNYDGPGFNSTRTDIAEKSTWIRS